MKTKIILAAALLFSGATVALHAQDMTSTNNSDHHWYTWDNTSTELYHSWEASIEAFGFGAVDEHTLSSLDGHRISRHGQTGAGAGLEFFFTKYTGIELEGFSESTSHSFVDNAAVNLVLRWPIGNSGFAPYIFGGGGHEFDTTSTEFLQAGGGLEYRFVHWISIFADGRYIAGHTVGNYAMGRAGVKFTF